MSRPNKKVKCVVCGETVHYAKTLYIELPKENIGNTKIVKTGRACRKHKQVKDFVERKKRSFIKDECSKAVLRTVEQFTDHLSIMEFLKLIMKTIKILVETNRKYAEFNDELRRTTA